MSLINNFFDSEKFGIDKSDYYLGKITTVSSLFASIQIENMSLLRYRFNQQDVLRPNTVNYHVLVESNGVVFIGKVINAKISDTDNIHQAVVENIEDVIYPSVQIKLIAMYEGERFVLPGELTVGIGDKVYVCNSGAIENYISSLEIYKKNNQIKFSNFSLNEKKSIPFTIDINNLFDHHLMLVGATNSGKSTSALAILDKYKKLNGKFLLIDPTGEYKDAFSKTEVSLGIVGKDLFLNTSNLTDEQWISLFNPNDNTQVVELLEAIKKLKFVQYYKKYPQNIKLTHVKSQFIKGDIVDCEGATKEEYEAIQACWESDEILNESFDINNLYKQIEKDSLKLRWNINLHKDIFQFDSFVFGTNSWLIRKVKYLTKMYKLNDLFLKESINNFNETEKGKNQAVIKDLNEELKKFGKDNMSLYLGLDNKNYSTVLGRIIVDYVSRFLLDHDMTEHPTILFIDEVHRYALEKDDQGELTSPLIALAREGRKNGVFLFLTTQSPKDVPSIVLNQMGTLLIHRLIGEYELKSISNFLDEKMLKQLSSLRRGQAILTSVNLIQPIVLNINASTREHNNNTPLLIKNNKEV